MAIDDLLTSWGYKLKKVSANEYSTSCPFCKTGDDRFKVWPAKDRFWCRVCNEKGDSIDLLQKIYGYTFQQAKWVKEKNALPLTKTEPGTTNVKPKTGKVPFNHPDHGFPDKKWIYTDENNNPLFAVCRWDKEGGKIISQCKPNGLSWTLGKIRKPLYNLQDVIKSDIIFIAEGEKKVDILTELGFKTATCSVGGASNWPKLIETDDIAKPLYGKTVYVFPDNDEPGRKHAENIVNSLYGNARTFIIELPDLPIKGDICDYVSLHGKEKSITDIISFIGKAKPWHPPSNFIDAVDLLETEFESYRPIISDGIMSAGAHILIAGESGAGKSLLRMQLSLCLAMGWDWLGFEIPSAKRIAVFQYENTESSEQKRLKLMCKGLGIQRLPKNSIKFVDRKNRIDLSLKKDREKLSELVKETESEVIFYDCLSNFHTNDENKNIAMREILDSFTEINSKVGTSCVLIHHFGKFIEGMKNQYRTRGASSILDWACTVMGFIEKPDENRILRKLEFYKVRDGKKPKTLLLERDEFFLLKVIDEDTLCPPIKVREILENIGGEVEKQSILTEAIIDEINCSTRSAQKFIRRAVEAKFVSEFYNGNGRSKKYKSVF